MNRFSAEETVVAGGVTNAMPPTMSRNDLTSFKRGVQRKLRSRSLPAVTLSALIICGLSISSCAKESVTKANPDVPRVVLSIRTFGGRCAGACNSELSTIKSDGEFSTVIANGWQPSEPSQWRQRPS